MLLICLISLLFIGYTSAQCPKPTNTTCSRPILDCCESNFRTALGFNSSICGGAHLYDNITCYRGAVENIYFGAGGSGTLLVCDAYNTFLGCLDQSIRSCTSYGWYMEQGIQYDLYSTIFYQQLMYQCGAGLEFFLNNGPCLNSAYFNNIPALEQCRSDFIKRISTNPPPTSPDVCFISDTFVNCWAKPFYLTCGDGGSWWGCEYARKSTHVLYPVCDTRCMAQLSFS
uniref:Uncharacterized protein n=1 Tax=Acrobeloides nanus TaxID=290746 RepID=A0A914BWA6_9BILA